MRHRMHAEQGFTLLEVMVAMVVMGLIAISLWSATSQTAKARDIVENTQEQQHHVRTAFAMIARDLSSAFLSMHRAHVDPTHDTVFVGTDGGSSDRLDFAAFSHTRRFFNVKESDQTEISYYLEDSVAVPGAKDLVRRASPNLDEKATEGGRVLVLLHDVEELDFEYYDATAQEWKTEWDTTQFTGEGSILPYQIRVRLVASERLGQQMFQRSDERRRSVTYGTQFGIPMRQAIWFKPYIPGPTIPVN